MTDARIFRYRGGKGRSFREIVNLMPPHDRYVETHLGGGAVMRNKRPAAASIGIELDNATAAAWRNFAMEGLTVLQGDCHHILPTLALRRGDLVYADPPYMPHVRRRVRCYRHDYTEAQHLDLLELLLSLPCAVIVSGYRSELYDDLLSEWWRSDYQATTRHGCVVESAWTNFAPGPPLHDYSFVGSGYREREALRRRRDGLTRGFRSADPIAVHAALADLAETHPAAILATARRIER